MTQSPQAAAANSKRLEGERIAGGKTFAVGQAVNIRLYDGAELTRGTVLGVETGGWYGNIVLVRMPGGETRRIVAARVTKAK